MDDNINIDDLPANLQRKLDRMEKDNELDKTLRLKPKTKEMAAKLEILRKDLKNKTSRDSDQSLLEYAVNLAYQRFEERRKLLEEHEDAMEFRTGN